MYESVFTTPFYRQDIMVINNFVDTYYRFIRNNVEIFNRKIAQICIENWRCKQLNILSRWKCYFFLSSSDVHGNNNIPV